MKVVGEDGLEFVLGKEGKSLFGRGSGYNTDDRFVSRQHVSFEVTNSLGSGKSDIRTEPRVLFEVIGRNPIWVWSKKNGVTSIFRKFEKGGLEAGDRFCLSGKSPLWFSLKQSEVQEEEKRVLETENETAESSHSELDFDDMDVSAIDSVKEFGFIKMGYEFDHYPNGMIRNVKDWEWFLDEPSKDSEDEEEFEKERRDMRRKRKKGKDNEDDEWTCESDDDKDIVAKTRKAKNSRGSRNHTKRSKDSKGQTKGSQNSRRKKATGVEETLKDEDDETLGGFIVDDEDEELEEENDDDEEEEEEFEEDDDEMEA